MEEDIRPGSGGRPPGCSYFKADHERAAMHVREKAPEVFEWIRAHPEGLSDDLPMHQRMWCTAKEIMPMASLIDLAEVGFILRLEAHPLTEHEKWKLENALHRSEEWRRRRRN
jgi:hypothetical protein